MSQDNRPGEICAETAPIPPRSTYVPSPKRDAAKARLRSFKRNRARWFTARAESFSGETYADLLEGGRARPYELGGDVVHALTAVLSPRAVALLGHVMACERGFGKNRGGVRLRHVDSARILRCSERTAGDAMRELVAHGLVEARWHFTMLSFDQGSMLAAREGSAGCYKHRERTPAYVTTKRAREFCGRRDRRVSRGVQVGKKHQPGKSPSDPPGLSKRCSGAGRPERRFVSDVQRARQVEKPAPPVATVILRLPDGRCALGSPLTPGVGRLANARVAKVRADDTSVEFFTTLCPGAWQAISDDETGKKGGESS